MVLVCNDPAFIFLKTTKTASTSVEFALQPFCLPPEKGDVAATPAIVTSFGIVGARGNNIRRSPSFWKFWQKHAWYNHMPAAAVKENLGAARFDQAAKIATVRNPFDRMVSDFHFFNRDTQYSAETFSQTRDRFRDYVLSESWTDDLHIVAIDGKVVIDHFIRMEHLTDDLMHVAGILGLDKTRLSLPHKKDFKALRKGHSTTEYFDPDTIDVVHRRMAWVFDHVDYPKTPAPPDISDVPTAIAVAER
ncbi:MAG: sulfotransferase family 2 domain-containing protein [Rhodobacteraceae bacterium]|nr:sulfotransferase domain-containing protein [Alphaproteobacteria bacterium]MBT8474750.1 sulfotransferase domain-containing protein [Alphaproteobacteria bacterium]NNK65491.1 sulfotransferase family 2 domain-containing protein [Paracoccaceae bacterium]